MNKYTDISQIEYEQLKELHLHNNFVNAFYELKRIMRGEELGFLSIGRTHKEYVEGKDFMELTEEDLRNAKIRCLGNVGIQKVIWLQKYLKGEVSGTFLKEEIKKDECAPLVKKIEELEQRILFLQQENRCLKKRNIKIKKRKK